MNIENNLRSVIEKIELAAKTKNKTKDEITLIGVTKTREIDDINNIIELGIKNIGENKVQEIQEKFDSIKGNPNIHMIGHLQTNKVKYIIDKVDLIHSLDRLSLAKEIQKRAVQHNKIQKVLIQLNISEEESKFGLNISELEGFLIDISNYSNILVKGIMTMAPLEKDSEKIRWVFKKAEELFNSIKKNESNNINMEFLSMGMTNDYEIAIQEGANMVRIGTAIFGERKQKL